MKEFILGASCMLSIMLTIDFAFPRPTTEHLKMAYKQGRKDALTRNSWDLEKTCAALWISNLPLPEDTPQ